MAYEREVEKGLEISRQAGRLALEYFEQATTAEEKDDFSRSRSPTGNAKADQKAASGPFRR